MSGITDYQRAVALAREQAVLGLLDHNPATVDQLASAIAVRVDAVASALVRLENRGLAKGHPGKRWTRANHRPPCCSLCLREFDDDRGLPRDPNPALVSSNTRDQQLQQIALAQEREQEVLRALDRLGDWASFEMLASQLAGAVSRKGLNSALRRLSRAKQIRHRDYPEAWRTL